MHERAIWLHDADIFTHGGHTRPIAFVSSTVDNPFMEFESRLSFLSADHFGMKSEINPQDKSSEYVG